ncbi:MAG: four helix bundle protein [Bacteroidia bacterium]
MHRSHTVSRSVKIGRASFSVPLNIAEGSGKFSNEGKKMYFSHVSRSTYDNNKLVKIRF